jgi:hypothetical protein
MSHKVKMLHIPSLAMALGIYLTTPVSAASQQTRNCGLHAQVVELQASTCGEGRQSLRLSASNSLIEVLHHQTQKSERS